MLDFFTPFITIALAELGDKSQISIFLLSSRIKNHFILLLGVMCGFAIVDGIAIFTGSWVVTLVPREFITIIAGVLFLVLGLLMIFQRIEPDDESPKLSKNTFLLGFTAIGLSEWGDKTQIAGALFALEYSPFVVFAAVMAALLLLSVIALVAGKLLAKKVNPRVTKRIAGVIFVILGIVSFL